MSAAGIAVRERMRALYDSYYASRDYELRYPRPNEGTLEFLWRHGAAQALHVADIGCGNGRYALPVLSAGKARLAGCDISHSALAAFAERLRGTGLAARVQLLAGGAESLPQAPPFDCFLMLFGVLSHIGPRQARLEALRQMRLRARPGAMLLLSVPNRWRRRPLDLLRAAWRREGELFGDIEFARFIGGRSQRLFYHLYSVGELRADLAETGWQVQAVEAESVMPEWLVTQSAWVGGLDRRLQLRLAPGLGYGIRVAARAAGE